MQSEREWIENWFVKNAKIGKDDLRKLQNDNYIEKGLIDSFGFIQLVNDIEKRYQIVFEDDDFENEHFFIISGLINIVEQHVKG